MEAKCPGYEVGDYNISCNLIGRRSSTLRCMIATGCPVTIALILFQNGGLPFSYHAHDDLGKFGYDSMQQRTKRLKS